MKKLLCILGLTVFLSGCGDEVKDNATATENSAEKATVVDEDNAAPKADETKLTDEKVAETTETNADNATPETPKNAQSAVENGPVSTNEKAPVVAKKPQQKKQKETTSKKLNDDEYNVNRSTRLSAEEARVSQTSALTESEIRYEKMQCRYPNMTAQERQENHCY